jgi:hypothetical protein
MNVEHKETAKLILGFKSVPFYVVFNEEGDIIQKGRKLDWKLLLPEEDKENIVAVVEKLVTEKQAQLQEDRVFVLEDLDF